MHVIFKFSCFLLLVWGVADEFVHVRRSDLERLLMEVERLKLFVAEEIRFRRGGGSIRPPRASQGA